MKGDTMRPLIEILEDERTLMQKLESIYRYMGKTEDLEILGILNAQKEKTEREINKVRTELLDYMEELLG